MSRSHGGSLASTGFGEAWPSQAVALWGRGGLPRSFLAPRDADSALWRAQFVRTFVERDLPQLGLQTPATRIHRFWTMLAHYHAQVWNASELGRALGVAHTTVREYLDRLAGAFVVRQLAPWHENIGKRQVKAPKVYVADSGVLHTRLGVLSHEDLMAHPKVGASWEGFALGEVIAHVGASPEECYFWRTHAGAELDLLVVRGRSRRGFEFKRSATPSLTRSMCTALEDLRLDTLDLIHPGEDVIPLAARVRAVGIARLLHDVEPL